MEIYLHLVWSVFPFLSAMEIWFQCLILTPAVCLCCDRFSPLSIISVDWIHDQALWPHSDLMYNIDQYQYQHASLLNWELILVCACFFLVWISPALSALFMWCWCVVAMVSLCYCAFFETASYVRSSCVHVSLRAAHSAFLPASWQLRQLFKKSWSWSDLWNSVY